MSKGFILIATHHALYHRFAVTLANSIKSFNNNIQITLLSDRPIDNKLFDNVIVLPQNIVKSATSAKVHIYDLSPYDETIYLDVDMIWLTNNSPEKLFEQFAGIDFTMSNEGYHEVGGRDTTNKQYPYWGDLKEMIETYGIKKLYKLRSEFIYFKKSDKVKRLFDKAKEVFEKPLTVTVSFNGGGVADEYAFNVASGVCELYPHKDNWTPIYWAWEHDKYRLKRRQIISDYYAYSLGGNRNKPEQAKFFNDLSKYFSKLTGLTYPMEAKNKREHIQTRVKI